MQKVANAMQQQRMDEKRERDEWIHLCLANSHYSRIKHIKSRTDNGCLKCIHHFLSIFYAFVVAVVVLVIMMILLVGWLIGCCIYFKRLSEFIGLEWKSQQAMIESDALAQAVDFFFNIHFMFFLFLFFVFKALIIQIELGIFFCHIYRTTPMAIKANKIN